MAGLITHGYAQAVFAGKRAGDPRFGGRTVPHGLGQDIYTKELRTTAITTIWTRSTASGRRARSNATSPGTPEQDGIVAACVRSRCRLCSPVHPDDGPLPGVIGNVYEAQDAMRKHTIAGHDRYRPGDAAAHRSRPGT
jgi:hypothetical protein